ncbi:protealysin inhibitor emfourin [Nocardioides sp.]|uniref:protealysin inhibitor emfourin n=1 Tax=Nocardioides sp. TaxID=35761 RepID=UPI002B279F90|nr:protealysin inhibitor emfourin [Nocardioides sp.]
MSLGTPHHCSFVPPYLIRRLGLLADADLDDRLRTSRAEATAPSRDVPTPPTLLGQPAWTVHTADQTTTLPGRPVRAAGQPATGDEAVDEAAVGISGALALFAEVYGRASYDDQGIPVSLTVHFGRDYPNAFWDGTQLVFGDGDGVVFDRFTRPVDVLAHELTHAVIERSAGLVYRDQPGALNESLADVFATCFKQRLLGQLAVDGDWLIGAELFLPGVAARGLRDLRAPGTAYDDPRLGRDPQPGHLDDYVSGPDDNGGVHINSGIPNRAFHLAAIALGGSSWEGAGRIWYDAMVGGEVGPETDFVGFAAATVAAAGPHAAEVAGAWAEVGVRTGDDIRVSQSAPIPASIPASTEGAPGAGVVRVQRSGGFAGRTTQASVALSDPAVGGELSGLVARVEAGGLPSSAAPTRPDMFCYDLDVCGTRARVPEHLLTDDLRRLVDLVLGAGEG